MAKRNIEINYNVLTRKIQTATGFNQKSENYEGATLNEKPMLHLQLVKDSSNSDYTELDDADIPTASIDTDFNTTTPLMTKTFSGSINQPGEWKEGGTALASLGQFSIPLDMYKAEVATRLGKKGKLTTSRLELKITEAVTADFVFKVIFPFYTFNLQDNAGAVGPEPEDNYYTKEEIQALIAGLDGAIWLDVDLLIAQNNIVYTVPANQMFKPEYGDVVVDGITGAGVTPSFKWVVNEPEDHELAPNLQANADEVGEYDGIQFDPGKFWPAGTTFRLVVTNASTFTTHTAKAVLKGVTVDA